MWKNLNQTTLLFTNEKKNIMHFIPTQGICGGLDENIPKDVCVWTFVPSWSVMEAKNMYEKGSTGVCKFLPLLCEDENVTGCLPRLLPGLLLMQNYKLIYLLPFSSHLWSGICISYHSIAVIKYGAGS